MKTQNIGTIVFKIVDWFDAFKLIKWRWNVILSNPDKKIRRAQNQFSISTQVVVFPSAELLPMSQFSFASFSFLPFSAVDSLLVEIPSVIVHTQVQSFLQDERANAPKAIKNNIFFIILLFSPTNMRLFSENRATTFLHFIVDKNAKPAQIVMPEANQHLGITIDKCVFLHTNIRRIIPMECSAIG